MRDIIYPKWVLYRFNVKPLEQSSIHTRLQLCHICNKNVWFFLLWFAIALSSSFMMPMPMLFMDAFPLRAVRKPRDDKSSISCQWRSKYFLKMHHSLLLPSSFPLDELAYDLALSRYKNVFLLICFIFKWKLWSLNCLISDSNHLSFPSPVSVFSAQTCIFLKRSLIFGCASVGRLYFTAKDVFPLSSLSSIKCVVERAVLLKAVIVMSLVQSFLLSRPKRKNRCLSDIENTSLDPFLIYIFASLLYFPSKWSCILLTVPVSSLCHSLLSFSAPVASTLAWKSDLKLEKVRLRWSFIAHTFKRLNCVPVRATVDMWSTKFCQVLELTLARPRVHRM